mgnify:CR=1 FL=1
MRKTFALTALAVAACGQAALLYDNGPWVTGTGNGFGGANTSAIEAGSNSFGFNIDTGAPFYVADDFTVGAQAWNLSSLSFYTYQTAATDGVPNSTSTLTSGRVAIFTSAPTDLTSNVAGGTLGSDGTLVGNVFTGVYRVSTALTNSQRAIMRVSVDLTGVTLNANTTYWAAWSADGSSTSGPWGVPVVPSLGTGNALQYSGGVWAALDGNSTTAGVQSMGMAFQIEGEPVPEPATMLALGGALAAFARRRRK